MAFSASLSSPGVEVITVYRGEDRTIGFAMSPVVDISGWTLLLTVEGDPETPKLISVAGVVVSASDGTFSVTLDDTTSGTDQSVGHYKYDVWRTDAGNERLLAIGSFIVEDSARFPE